MTNFLSSTLRFRVPSDMMEIIQAIPNGDLTTLKCSLGYSEISQSLILAIQKMDCIPEIKVVDK